MSRRPSRAPGETRPEWRPRRQMPSQIAVCRTPPSLWPKIIRRGDLERNGSASKTFREWLRAGRRFEDTLDIEWLTRMPSAQPRAICPACARHMRAATSARRPRIGAHSRGCPCPVMPAAMAAPMMAPIDEPAIDTGRRPSSSRDAPAMPCAMRRQRWGGRRAPPKVSARRRWSSLAATGPDGPTTIIAGSADSRRRAAASTSVDRDLVDLGPAPGDVVDAEIIELQFDHGARQCRSTCRDC